MFKLFLVLLLSMIPLLSCVHGKNTVPASSEPSVELPRDEKPQQEPEILEQPHQTEDAAESSQKALPEQPAQTPQISGPQRTNPDQDKEPAVSEEPEVMPTPLLKTPKPEGPAPQVAIKPPDVGPPALDKKDIVRSIIEASTDAYSLVYHKTGPFINFVDINGDGLLDGGGVFVASDEEAKTPDLTDIGRLYNVRAVPYDFFYQTFLHKKGVLHKDKPYFLGKRVVIQGLREIKIKPEPGAVHALSIIFPTTEGTEDEWIIFSPAGVSRLSLKESFSTYPAVYDLDEDGVQDIAIFSKVFEEGVGVETFITWYKWSGTAFREHKTTNIVRNLNQFLSRATNLLIQGEVDDFIDFILRPADAVSFKRRLSNGSNPLLFLFEPLNQETEYNDLYAVKNLKIYDVTFPEIMENPFFKGSFKDYSFSPVIRLTTSEGAYFVSATVRMSSNPFTSQKQFYFQPQR